MNIKWEESVSIDTVLAPARILNDKGLCVSVGLGYVYINPKMWRADILGLPIYIYERDMYYKAYVNAPGHYKNMYAPDLEGAKRLALLYVRDVAHDVYHTASRALCEIDGEIWSPFG